jgi:hypothetical protein
MISPWKIVEYKDLLPNEKKNRPNTVSADTEVSKLRSKLYEQTPLFILQIFKCVRNLSTETQVSPE